MGILTNHSQSFRLQRRGSPASGAPAASCRWADYALASALLGLLILPLIGAIGAVAMGAYALSQIEREPELTGRGRAIAALIIGGLGLVGWGIYLFSEGMG